MFEVEFLVKLEELKKEFPTAPLNYYKKLHVVIKDSGRKGGPELVGDMDAFAAFALTEFNIDNAEAFNTVLYNRQVREISYSMMSERGRPIVFLELLDTDSKDPMQLGTLFIEL